MRWTRGVLKWTFVLFGASGFAWAVSHYLVWEIFPGLVLTVCVLAWLAQHAEKIYLGSFLCLRCHESLSIRKLYVLIGFDEKGRRVGRCKRCEKERRLLLVPQRRAERVLFKANSLMKDMPPTGVVNPWQKVVAAVAPKPSPVPVVQTAKPRKPNFKPPSLADPPSF